MWLFFSSVVSTVFTAGITAIVVIVVAGDGIMVFHVITIDLSQRDLAKGQVFSPPWWAATCKQPAI